MYSIENFRAFNVRCFSDPRTFFNSELLSIYGISILQNKNYIITEKLWNTAKNNKQQIACKFLDVQNT